jgi:hypothetical protein
MAHDPDIPDEYLRALFAYDPETGKFARKIPYGSQAVGSEPGSLSPQGYRQIGVMGRTVPAHRLAWRYVHGVWPSGDVDHINGTRDDNRIVNLRDVTRSQNSLAAQRPGKYPNPYPQKKRTAKIPC